MRKILLFVFAFSFANLSAQDYTILTIESGYNADVIANGVNPSLLSTTSAMDNANYAFMSADFQALPGDTPPDYALPISRMIDNVAMPGLSFHLADYAGDNSLRLQEQFDSGTFNFNNTASLTTLYVLASTGSGNATLGGTIHFSDNSTQQIISGVIPDWFYSDALPVVISGFGRVNRETDVIENPLDNPRMYQFQIDILPENQLKVVTSIDFSKQSSEEGAINIFAVSAQQLGTCPAPGQLTVTNITSAMATISWTEPVIVPTAGYQYYISVGNIPPTASSDPTGTIDAGVTVLTLGDLITGETYCIWIRSACEGGTGPWSEPICFTPGQVEVTNPDDIPTLYADAVDVNSTTTCPGTLTVNVPVGYQIASVATSYDMQTALNGWMSEQRSILVCNTTGLMESQITAGVGGTTGTYSYERTGLDIANGATGDVEFELRAWRTYGSSDCNTDYNRVVAGTWTVTVTLEEMLGTAEFSKNTFAVYPNPAEDVLHIAGGEMISEVTLFNVLGQTIAHQNGLNAQTMQLTTSGLPTGKYLLKIVSESGVQSKSILKK